MQDYLVYKTYIGSIRFYGIHGLYGLIWGHMGLRNSSLRSEFVGAPAPRQTFIYFEMGTESLIDIRNLVSKSW